MEDRQIKYVSCAEFRELALHMLAQCSYSKLVWSGLDQWIGT
jgi:hypothetical protein